MVFQLWLLTYLELYLPLQAHFLVQVLVAMKWALLVPYGTYYALSYFRQCRRVLFGTYFVIYSGNMPYMAAGSRKTTVESKALSIAIKRAMAIRGLKTPGLAKASSIPYGTLRKILELNTVADYEQLRKIAIALGVPLSAIVADSEKLVKDPGIVEDYLDSIQQEPKSSATVDSSVSDSSASNASSSSDASSVPPSATDDDYISHIADLIAADPSRFALMAHTDPNKFLESSTPRD